MIAASRQTVAGRADRAAMDAVSEPAKVLREGREQTGLHEGRRCDQNGAPSAPSRGQEVREVVLGRDLSTRETEAEGLGREHLDLRAVPLEAIWVEVVAHHGGGLLELRLQPWRGVREPLLGRGEAVVAGNERLGEAPGDPWVRLPRLAPDDDEVLRWERPGRDEVLALDSAEVRK